MLLLGRLTDIWLSSSHLAGIQPKKSYRSLGLWPSQPNMAAKNFNFWKHVSSVSKIVQPCPSPSCLLASTTVLLPGGLDDPGWPGLPLQLLVQPGMCHLLPLHSTGLLLVRDDAVMQIMIFNTPGVAGALLQTPLSLIH